MSLNLNIFDIFCIVVKESMTVFNLTQLVSYNRNRVNK